MKKKMKTYIDYLSKKHNFQKVRKEFENYDKAKRWGVKNIPNFNIDMIRYYD